MTVEAAPARGPGRPPKPRAEVAPSVSPEPNYGAAEGVAEPPQLPRLIEVRLIRKYVPHNLYERDDERSSAPVVEKDKQGKDVVLDPGLLVVRPVINKAGRLVIERDIVEGEVDDKFGRKVPVKKQIMTDYPANTVIALPAAEAERALKLGIAEVTTNTFSFAA